ILITIVCCMASSFAQPVIAPPQPVSSPAATNPAGTITVERQQSFALNAMDTSVDPCEDFYEFACGKWRKDNPVPSDQLQWARYNKVAEYNREVLRNLLDAAANGGSGRSETAKVIGDFYSSCMNEDAANKKGAAPLQAELARIAAVANKDQLIEAVA